MEVSAIGSDTKLECFPSLDLPTIADIPNNPLVIAVEKFTNYSLDLLKPIHVSI